MQKKLLFERIKKVYGVEPDYPFNDENAVFRHKHNKKWFALVMSIPENKFGLKSDKKVDVVNLKCDPNLTEELFRDFGIFPAYHMSKTKWISVLLDGRVDFEKVKMLVDVSYYLTEKKPLSRVPARDSATK